MVQCVKHFSYKTCYRNFILLHTYILILYICGIGAYCFMIILPTIKVLARSVPYYGSQMIFAFVIPLALIIFAVIACIDIKQYSQEIIRLLSGNVLVKVGRIVEKSRNVYTIKPISSKNKEPKFAHFSYPKFFVRNRNCERILTIGDNVKIIYPCSPRLSVRTTQQLYAIYVFSTDEECSLNTQEFPASKRKSTVFIYLTVVTLLSASLLYVLFIFINWLLGQTFLR